MNGKTRDLGKRVAAEFKQKFEGTVEGPHRIGHYSVSRVWTEDVGGEYHAHYAVEHKGKLKTFDNFSPFAIWLTDQFDLDAEAGRSEREVQLGIGVIVILAGLGLLIYLIVRSPPQGNEVINYLLAAIIGAASSFVFVRRTKGR